MEFKKLNFFYIFCLSLVIIIIQYLCLYSFYDSNNFLFGDFGDDYNYINNFKYINNANITLIGLAQLGLITPYNYILYLLVNAGGVFLYWLIEFLLFAISNFFFYKIAITCLNKKNAYLALIIFLILPLRYIWLFGYYKDSLLLSLSIIFVFFFYFKRKALVPLILGIPIFLIRPLLLGILIGSGQKIRFNFKTLGLILTSIVILFYIFQEYLYFFRIERIEILMSKMNTLPFNSSGMLTIFYMPFLWVLTQVQPLFLAYNNGEVWHNISPVVQVDALLKLLLMPLIIKGLLNTRFYLKDKKISIILKLMLVLSFPVAIGFLFLTNRHILIILPWQIIFGFYVYQTKGYSINLLFLYIMLTITLNFLKL
ncbi:hypothetical protein ACOSP6_03100 [Tenacibaculum sp. MEBiC06402]|uniref:hypothetical protein n=1 Tax=unclassified Tenacibaculum TaxID=2635139 RepID=UPI003B9D60E0